MCQSSDSLESYLSQRPILSKESPTALQLAFVSNCLPLCLIDPDFSIFLLQPFSPFDGLASTSATLISWIFPDTSTLKNAPQVHEHSHDSTWNRPIQLNLFLPFSSNGKHLPWLTVPSVSSDEKERRKHHWIEHLQYTMVEEYIKIDRLTGQKWFLFCNGQQTSPPCKSRCATCSYSKLQCHRQPLTCQAQPLQTGEIEVVEFRKPC